MTFLANAVPSPKDERDYYYSPIITGNFPPRLDLIPDVFAVENQLSQGSCVWHGIPSMAEILLKRAGKGRHLSREFGYHETLKAAGRLGQEGCNPRDAFKVGRKLGIPDESIWPYDISKRDVDPPQSVYDAALLQRIDRYENLYFQPWGYAEKKLTMIKGALMEGLPVGFVMPVTESYQQVHGPLAQQFYLPYGKAPPIGYHFQVFTGYEDSYHGLTALNSWDNTWGDGGFGMIPYRELDCVVEAWVMRGFDGCGTYRAPGIYCTRNDRTGISAQIVPTEQEDRKPVKVWIGAVMAGAGYLKTDSGAWLPYDGTFPPAIQATFDGALDINIKDGDFSDMHGVDVYVGYGKTPFDWKTSKICTL